MDFNHLEQTFKFISASYSFFWIAPVLLPRILQSRLVFTCAALSWHSFSSGLFRKRPWWLSLVCSSRRMLLWRKAWWSRLGGLCSRVLMQLLACFLALWLAAWSDFAVDCFLDAFTFFFWISIRFPPVFPLSFSSFQMLKKETLPCCA